MSETKSISWLSPALDSFTAAVRALKRRQRYIDQPSNNGFASRQYTFPFSHEQTRVFDQAKTYISIACTGDDTSDVHLSDAYRNFVSNALHDELKSLPVDESTKRTIVSTTSENVFKSITLLSKAVSSLKGLRQATSAEGTGTLKKLIEVRGTEVSRDLEALEMILKINVPDDLIRKQARATCSSLQAYEDACLVGSLISWPSDDLRDSTALLEVAKRKMAEQQGRKSDEES